MIPRFLHHFYAWLFGYFWIPCPVCQDFFGGHEVKNGGTLLIPHTGNRHAPPNGLATCPRCPGYWYRTKSGEFRQRRDKYIFTR